MARTKYIVVKEVRTEHGTAYNIPIIFPECINHDIMAGRFGGKQNVRSAGFVSIGITSDFGCEYHTYGESISMGLKSHEDDARVIRRVFEDY